VLPSGITPRKRGILNGNITSQEERSWYRTQPILPQRTSTNQTKQPSNQTYQQEIHDEGYNHHQWRKGERFWVSGGHFRNFCPACSGKIMDITNEGPLIKFDDRTHIEKITWKNFNKIGKRPTRNQPYSITQKTWRICVQADGDSKCVECGVAIQKKA